MQTSTKLVPREIDKMITYGRIYKMKKLLGIVVLGLLWCNVSFAETKRPELNKDYVYSDLNLNILKYNWKIDKVRSTSEADIYILKKNK